MATCACGALLDGTGTSCRRYNALAVLGVPSTASFREIKQAYQLLVKVWHPDRFQSDKSVLGAVDARMKEVNSAFAFLKEHPDPVRPQDPEPGPHTPFVPGGNAQASPSVRPSQGTSGFLRLFRGLIPSRRLVLRLAGLLIALLVVRYLWIALDFGEPTNPEVARVVRSGKDRILGALEQPKTRFLNAVESDLARLNPFRSHAPQNITPQIEPPASRSQSNSTASVGKDRNANRARVQRILPLITIGSTKSEVINLLGPPTSNSGDQLAYGQSVLYLYGDSVVGWRIDPESAPMRVKIWPTTPVDPSLEEFGVGSSKDEVLAVQGTPTAFSTGSFEYGRSVVFFKGDRVIGWKNDPASISLHVVGP